MPVHIPFLIECMSRDEFGKLDYKVMKHAYDCQNTLGNLANERVYQSDFAIRLMDSGFEVDREVEISVFHKTFRKSLFLDHVINRKAVYELKADAALSNSHRLQLLTYLYLLDLTRGKLINFGSQKVGAEFVNSAVTPVERRTFELERSNYSGPEFLIQLVCELVEDWGTGLSVNLYREAATVLLGGADTVETTISVQRKGLELGSQRFQLVLPSEAFYVSAVAKPENGFSSHLERLIRLTSLRRLHWINICHQRLLFVTIFN